MATRRWDSHWIRFGYSNMKHKSTHTDYVLWNHNSIPIVHFKSKSQFYLCLALSFNVILSIINVSVGTSSSSRHELPRTRCRYYESWVRDVIFQNEYLSLLVLNEMVGNIHHLIPKSSISFKLFRILYQWCNYFAKPYDWIFREPGSQWLVRTKPESTRYQYNHLS